MHCFLPVRISQTQNLRDEIKDICKWSWTWLVVGSLGIDLLAVDEFLQVEA